MVSSIDFRLKSAVKWFFRWTYASCRLEKGFVDELTPQVGCRVDVSLDLFLSRAAERICEWTYALGKKLYFI